MCAVRVIMPFGVLRQRQCLGWWIRACLSINITFGTKDTFQSLDDDDVFAVDDCATQVNQPRPKAGNFMFVRVQFSQKIFVLTF